MIYSRQRVAERLKAAEQAKPQMLLGEESTAAGSHVEMTLLDQAMEVLNRVGARQWSGMDRWCISIPRRYEQSEEVLRALAQLEVETGITPLVVWSRRKD